jgi:SPP1 family predicted phage head-tail adaptor
MTDPGKLNRRLVLEEPVLMPDGAGGIIRTYQALTTLWAAVVPVAASETVMADGATIMVTHRITIRGGPEVTLRHRFRWGARVFQVAALRDRDGDGRFVEIAAEERTG